MSALELRYAEAFLTSVPYESADGAGASLSGFSVILTQNCEVREFLLDPTVPSAIRKETSEKLMSESAVPLIKDFIFLLIDKGRLALLPGICAAYAGLNAKRHNSPDICVYSAMPLDDEQIAQIGDKYRKRYNIPAARVCLSVDRKLLGGIMVKIGDIRIDGTLLGRLNGLRQTLERK